MSNMIYTASERETFDQIALRVYGDEKYAYLLLQTNPQYSHKIMMDGGEVLTVPDMPKDKRTELPPWKKGA